MEAFVRRQAELSNVLAYFTLDGRRLRVEPANSGNHPDNVGKFTLDGICYVVIAEAEISDIKPILTRREREIALHIASGQGTKQIAYKLGISPHTATTYVNRIRAKLGVRNRPEMVAALLRSTPVFWLWVLCSCGATNMV